MFLDRDDWHASTLGIRKLLHHEGVPPWGNDIDRPLILKKLPKFLISRGRNKKLIKKTRKKKLKLEITKKNLFELWELHKPCIEL